MKPRLKPVVYTTHVYSRGSQNTTQQMLLLKAMQVTQDPKQLRAMIGVKTVADVYRTLDKLSMRKEYHSALLKLGIDFDFIASGIKDIAESGEKDGDRLKAFQTLLKSIGLDKYDGEGGSSGSSWEEELLKSIETKKDEPTKELAPHYEVITPVIPESARKQREDEAEALGSIYE